LPRGFLTTADRTKRKRRDGVTIDKEVWVSHGTGPYGFIQLSTGKPEPVDYAGDLVRFNARGHIVGGSAFRKLFGGDLGVKKGQIKQFHMAIDVTETHQPPTETIPPSAGA
jgi:hypothetical protein